MASLHTEVVKSDKGKDNLNEKFLGRLQELAQEKNVSELSISQEFITTDDGEPAWRLSVPVDDPFKPEAVKAPKQNSSASNDSGELSGKFDELSALVDELKEENASLKKEQAELKEALADLQSGDDADESSDTADDSDESKPRRSRKAKNSEKE